MNLYYSENLLIWNFLHAQGLLLNLSAAIHGFTREEAEDWITAFRNYLNRKDDCAIVGELNYSELPLSTIGHYASSEKLDSEKDCDENCLTEFVPHGLFPNPNPPNFNCLKHSINVKSFQNHSLDRCNTLLNSKAKTVYRIIISPTTVRFVSSKNKTHLNSLNPGPSTYSAQDHLISPIIGAMHLLQTEIMNTGGIEISVQSDDLKSVAFVDIDHRVWVAGWKTKCTRIHNLFHLGDELMLINNQWFENSNNAYQIFETVSNNFQGPDSICHLRLRRLPLAKVFAVRRTSPGQTAGLKLEGKYSNVSCVVPNGLASQVHLPSVANAFKPTESKSNCLWSITEINNQTISLYCKPDEVQYLMNAYGLEMTFVVQPADFIHLMRKQLKCLRSYLDYVPR